VTIPVTKPPVLSADRVATGGAARTSASGDWAIDPQVSAFAQSWN
jgi:hypothetical protein